MTTHILGVDPGASGALALFNPDTNDLILQEMPSTKSTRGNKSRKEVDGYGLGIWIDTHKHLIKKAIVEQVSGRPGQAGQFAFGLNCGVLHGVLYANLIPVEFVAPNKWKPALGLRKVMGQTKADAKADARRLAMQRFPELAKHFMRVKDDGVAEAALLAVYGAMI